MISSNSTPGRASYNGYLATRPAIIGLAKVIFLGFCQVSSVAAVPLLDAFKDHEHNHDTPDGDDASLWLYLGVAVILVLLGGAFAGLTIALMGQDGVYLQVISTSGEGKEQRHAEKVLNLLNKGKHWVLVTLLLSNVIVNETLPIILDRSLGGGWPAVLGSTALIVIFGEVIPQSICVRYGLSIGAFMAPSVLILMWVLSPIAWPTAKLLDKLLGEDHGTVYKKSGLKTLVTLHKTLGNSPTDRLNQDEVTIISAVLDLKDKAVGHIMTPMEDVFTMCEDQVLDEETMNNILSAGYSRIPIHKADNELNFVGMLLVKILITYDPEDCMKVRDFALATLPETRPETSCLDIINFFQEGKSHMVMVSEFPGENYGAQGVVTLEDVIEELIGEEIIDESDVYIDVHKAIRRMAPAPKARVHKGHVVVDKPAHPVSEEDLIDLSAPHIDAPKRKGNGDERNHSPMHTHPAFGTSPKTTFLKRSTSGTDAQPIAVRGNVNDMREHLKHLGPSNVASRPKTTRYQTVKIKLPGVSSVTGTAARSASVTGSMGYSRSVRSTRSIIDEPYHDDPSVHGGEGAGLIKSGMEAKDGVQALQQGYGSLNYSTSPKNTRAEAPIVAEGPTYQAPTYRKSMRDYSPAVLSRNGSDKSSDTLKSLRSGSPRPWKRGTARSGSITEHTIESNGFQKVVLQTSSSDIEESGESSQGKKSESNSPDSKTSASNEDSIEQTEENGTGKSEEGKKKRRRQRKKKPKTGEASTGGESSTVGEASTMGG